MMWHRDHMDFRQCSRPQPVFGAFFNIAGNEDAIVRRVRQQQTGTVVAVAYLETKNLESNTVHGPLNIGFAVLPSPGNRGNDAAHGQVSEYRLYSASVIAISMADDQSM